MRMNQDTIICGDKVVLVPYRKEHVPTYHEWMKSPELLAQTASEPLSFEEELEMQRKWQEDEDSAYKLTFIVLARVGGVERTVLTPAEVAACPMVGDVNLFLPEGPRADVECEIMIADPAYRGKGLAYEALTLFLTYVVRGPLSIAPTQLIARIGASNTASVRLFERLGFGRVKLVKVFDELEMRWGWTSTGEGEEDGKGSAEGEWPVESVAERVGRYSGAAAE